MEGTHKKCYVKSKFPNSSHFENPYVQIDNVGVFTVGKHTLVPNVQFLAE
jgi:hypothetical protein